MDAFLCKVVVAIVNPLILLITMAAFIYFLWGLAKFIIDLGRGDEAAGDGKRSMFWGIVGLVIIFGAYGIINLAVDTANGVGFSIATFTGPKCAAPATTTTSPFGGTTLTSPNDQVTCLHTGGAASTQTTRAACTSGGGIVDPGESP